MKGNDNEEDEYKIQLKADIDMQKKIVKALEVRKNYLADLSNKREERKYNNTM